ncbi:MAG TPA: CarD family transcriptional regulator [Blastocatellia bacterium]|jgi:CarD family transcriptional regulator|nr:CarD family transcriptional regulator [Blastocatellia bacterium]
MLAIGNKVNYPCHGPCLISSITERTVGDRPMSFYQLLVLNDGDLKLLIPVEKLRTVGLRPLLNKAEIPKLLDRLKRRTKGSVDRKQRVLDNLKLLSSGSAFDLAEIVATLNGLLEVGSLSFGERSTFDRAKRLLVCEISEVMEETKEEAEAKVDLALSIRTHKSVVAG